MYSPSITMRSCKARQGTEPESEPEPESERSLEKFSNVGRNNPSFFVNILYFMLGRLAKEPPSITRVLAPSHHTPFILTHLTVYALRKPNPLPQPPHVHIPRLLYNPSMTPHYNLFKLAHLLCNRRFYLHLPCLVVVVLVATLPVLV